MDVTMQMTMGSAPQAGAAAAPEPAYHPDDDLSTWEMYALADADDITVDVGIERWDWRGANANCWKQNTDANQPLYDPEGSLGFPCAVFDGSNDLLSARNGADSANITIADYMTATSGIRSMVVVCVPTTIASNAAGASDNDTPMGDASGFAGISFRSTPSVRAYNFDSNLDASGAIVVGSPPVACVVTNRKSATTLFASLNGAAEVTGVASGNTTLTAQGQLGQGPFGAGKFTGEVYLVACTKSDVGATEMAAIAGRLATYFGIGS